MIGVRFCVAALALAGCAGAPPPPDWQFGAHAAMIAFERHYLAGDTRLAEQEFARAKSELARTGRGDLLARAELARCAARAASLEFDDCPGFERLRAEAGPQEIEYREYLAGRRERAATDEALSRLVAAGVKLRSETISPAEIAGAAEIASAQGWRRPLLAWLGVLAKRAEAAGDADALARLRKKIARVAGDGGGSN